MRAIIFYARADIVAFRGTFSVALRLRRRWKVTTSCTDTVCAILMIILSGYHAHLIA